MFAWDVFYKADSQKKLVGVVQADTMSDALRVASQLFEIPPHDLVVERKWIKKELTWGYYSVADAEYLNDLKNRLRAITSLLDTGKIYPDTIESQQVQHEVFILLVEMQAHGLLSDDVHLGN